MKPKVKFEVAKVEDYFDVLKVFFLQRENKGIYRAFPGLEEKIDNSKDKEKTLFDYFKSKEKELWYRMKEYKRGFEKDWRKYEEKIMAALEEVHETEWDEKFNEFKARITLNPVCPRYLDYNAFDVFYKNELREIKRIILHEVSHFIFFQKLKEIYPNIDKRKFDRPHLIWKFSEMIPSVILGDERIQKIFKHKPLVYDQIQNTSIQGRKILDYLHEFYNNRKDFEDFVKKSLSFLESNRKELEEQF